MEVVAPRDVAPAPFALCPRFQLLAVGMVSSPASAETVASRVDVLRPSGDHDLGRELQVDCFVRAPGLRHVAWSSSPTMPDDSPLVPVEQVTYPAGLIAGGFDDGSVRIWSPDPVLLCDLKSLSVPAKPKAEILNPDPNQPKIDQAGIDVTVSKMYSEMKQDNTISWTYSGHKDYFQIKEETEDERSERELISKKERVVNHHMMTQMTLVTEACSLQGPVLGLSFNELHPHWIGTAALGERICVHDLHHPLQLYRKKLEVCDNESKVNAQITCLKWSKIHPCILATAGDAGFLSNHPHSLSLSLTRKNYFSELWDVRTSRPATTFNAENLNSSDLEFSWNNPMHIAVSTLNNERAAPIKVWDMRNIMIPHDAYGSSGVVSLSWNRSGLLLASHESGSLTCYDVYQKKMLEEKKFVHSDLGSIWTHSDDVAASLSSKTGIKLYEIRG